MKSLLIALSILFPFSSAQAREIPESEAFAGLLEGSKETTSLVELERLGLNNGKTKLDLWSGSYWPYYQGALASRYRDPSYIELLQNNKVKWEELKEHSLKRPAFSSSVLENLLSPAEKYDLLVGDRAMSLTNYSWEVGEKSLKGSKVPIWRGICDGWASASQMMPRPVKSVTMKTPQGSSLTFYPEDIKALGSLLYARAQQDVIFIGKRCHNRLIGVFNNSCSGTNPGTFHKALVNRVGKMKKSFIADVSPGSEVWNYPVKNYKFTYYNVLNKEESQNFKKVMELFSKDKRFAKSSTRSEKTYAIVGVKAEVEFTDMREANLFDTDGSSMDKTLTKTYNYDLELDAGMNIIGGESISKNLPDFIWAANDRTYPLSLIERKTNLREEDLVEAAQSASKLGQPLSIIVEKLFEAAKQ